MKTSDKVALLRELGEYDHGFISAEGVAYFTAPFGFAGSTIRAYDTRDEPKGLMLADRHEPVEGQDAAVVAEQIARHVNPQWSPTAFGRGTRLRMAVAAAIAALEKEEVTNA